ncbi:MAG: ATP-binding protein [Caldilineaceae bacterium]
MTKSVFVYPVRPDALGTLHADLSVLLARAGLQPSPQANSTLWAALEIAANIIEHAHAQTDPQDAFWVDVTCNEHCIEIVLRDLGIACDSERLRQSNLPTDWRTHQRGGLGLPLAHRAVDHLTYTREDNVNVWRIVIKQGSGATDGSDAERKS